MTTPVSPTAPVSSPSPEHADPLPDGLVDVVVLGGGAAGLNAALMLGRSRRSVVVLDAGDPRNAPAEGIHGLLGNEGTPPAEFLARGRAEVRTYGGLVVPATVRDARAIPSEDGDLRFRIELTDGRAIEARRVVVATGLRDELPAIPGLAAHWGHGVVHCPFCHGYEVRDRAIGIPATQPSHAHLALLFRALSEDVVVFAPGVRFEEADLARFAALGIVVREEPIQEVVSAPDGALAGVRLAGGEVIARDVLATGTRMVPRLDGLEGLGLPVEEMPLIGAKVASGRAGATGVPGVWVAGNVAEPTAQVGASAAAGALAGAQAHVSLVMAQADAAVVALARTA